MRYRVWKRFITVFMIIIIVLTNLPATTFSKEIKAATTSIEKAREPTDNDSGEIKTELNSYKDSGIIPLNSGFTNISIANKNDQKITKADEFAIGAFNSDRFTINLLFTAENQESFQVTIPDGFTADVRSVDGFSLSTKKADNGDTIYTYAATTASSTGTYECDVSTDFEKLLSLLSGPTPRTKYIFKSEIINQENEIIDTSSFEINVPELATYKISQVDTYNNNFIWTPYDIAGPPTSGILHSSNQADSNRPGQMTKRLQIQLDKTAGATISNDMLLHLELPIYIKSMTNYNYLNATNGKLSYPQAPQMEIYVNGEWKSMQNMTNGFNKIDFPTNAKFDTKASGLFGLPSNQGDTSYYNALNISLLNNLATSYKVDTGLGVEKTVYEWLCEATSIRFCYGCDVMWDPVYNDESPECQFSTNAISDNKEQFIAKGLSSLSNGGTEVTTDAPFQMTLQNGSDKSLNVGIATIDKIQMDVTTTKTTTGEPQNRTGDGYVAAFSTAKNNNYSYFTNMTASFDFPWEYSPTGTIQLSTLSENGFYNQERNQTCYDYVFTISNKDGSFRKKEINHLGFVDPITGKPVIASAGNTPTSYTPDLSEDEWVSNITVTAPKIWKQSITTDTSALSVTGGQNHPLFYANCTSKSTYKNGDIHNDQDVVTVKSSISTDQTGLITGIDKNVILIAPVDNIVIWSKNMSKNIYPIGEYGDTKLSYIELHAKKYTDTPVYKDPYFELTGDAVSLLNKITYATNIGTESNPIYNYLTLRGYRLNDGEWVDITDPDQYLNSSKGYYDLSSVIGTSGKYLTGIRLAPLNLNDVIVDTTTSPEEIDKYDNVKKHYYEEKYYLYLYDSVMPNVLGYNDTLAHTYTSIKELNSPLSYDIGFHCDRIANGHNLHEHIADTETELDKLSATLIYGDLPDNIFARDNDYDILTSAPSIPEGWKKYYLTELCNVAIDDGPANKSTINAWGEMKSATLTFGNSTADEKRTLALTKGVSLIGSNWQGASYMTPEHLTAIVKYKTNKSSDWITVNNDFKVPNNVRDDRAVYYFTLEDKEYITDIKVEYPMDFMYKAGYSVANKEDPSMRHLQLPDVGLLTNGPIETKSPVENDSYIFTNGEQLQYSASLTYVNMADENCEYNLNNITARLQPYPTMLVDNFSSTVSYKGTNDSALSVYQGGVLLSSLTHKYSFTTSTKNIDIEKKVHPTICYEINKNFTIADIVALSNSLGVTSNQISLTPKKDGSGNSILRIKYGPQGPQTRDVTFDITIPLTAKPNAQVTNIVPIVNIWMSLDYDLNLNEADEGEKISINPTSTILESDPTSILQDWTTDRLALKNVFTTSVNINKYNASSMQFYGTDGSGGGIGSQVTGRDGTGENVFGIGETLYAPSDDSTNWVIYIAIPAEGQKIPYTINKISDASDFGLMPSAPINLDATEGTTFVTEYFIPYKQSTIPSMSGLTLTNTDTITSIIEKDDEADAELGVWKTWDELINDDQDNISYVRILADKVAGGTELSSTLLMSLNTKSSKTVVDTMKAHTSLIYNYITKGGGMAFPSTEPGNMDLNGKASNLITYSLLDFNITGQLWHELNFNNTFVSGTDLLTKDGIQLTITDNDGNTIYHKTGEPVIITPDPDTGTYTVPVPSKGTYKIKLVSTNKNWKPVKYNSQSIMNGMKFDHNESMADNEALATVVIENNDVAYINGGIEEWGQLTVTKSILGKFADLTKEFKFTIKPSSSSIKREYKYSLKHTGEDATDGILTGGSDNEIRLGNNDYITIELPVGLQYVVSDISDSIHETEIQTYENGATNNEVESVIDKNTVTNKIVSITYTGETSNGGNKEVFTNNRITPVISGINLDISSILLVILSIFIFIIYTYLQHKKKKRVLNIIIPSLFMLIILFPVNNTFASENISAEIKATIDVTGNGYDSNKEFKVKCTSLNDSSNEIIEIKSNETKSFNKLNYIKSGLYKYNVSVINDKTKGYVFDDRVYEVNVYVSMIDGQNKITQTTIDTKTNKKVKEIKFWNSYQNKVDTTGSLYITMEIKNAPIDETFQIRIDFSGIGADGEYIYTDKNGTVLGTIHSGDVVNLKNGDSIYIIGLPVGLKYTITQTPKPGYIAESLIWKGIILANSVNKAPYINIYERDAIYPVIIDPPIQKQIRGEVPKHKSTFRFMIMAEDITNPMPEGSQNGKKIVSIQGAGTVEMGNIKFTKPGTYKYTISEINDEIKNYIYDTNKITMTVDVINDNGVLKATKTINNKDTDIVFINKYSIKSTSDITGTVQTGDTFNFTTLILLGLISITLIIILLISKKRTR